MDNLNKRIMMLEIKCKEYDLKISWDRSILKSFSLLVFMIISSFIFLFLYNKKGIFFSLIALILCYIIFSLILNIIRNRYIKKIRSSGKK